MSNVSEWQWRMSMRDRCWRLTDKEQFMSMVIDPRPTQDEISRPVVSWSGAEPQGNESWQGALTLGVTVPQVELRHTLDDGVTAVVRLNIGDLAHDAKGREVEGGVVISRNESGVSIAFSWLEWWQLQEAIVEGIDRLTIEQEEIYAQLGQRWAGSGSEVVGGIPE